jgi:DNA-3-methyladenine glycosylase I
VRSGRLDALHVDYHDRLYGFPLRDDDLLFERLMLEINQAGLSWSTILRKQHGFRTAYDGFNVDRVAAYGADDVARLLSDPGIIRNRLKVAAAVENARRIVAIRSEHGSFVRWLDAHHPRELADWQRLFKQHFVFTGAEIVREFMISTGYVAGAHDEGCPVMRRIVRLRPPWTKGWNRRR